MSFDCIPNQKSVVLENHKFVRLKIHLSIGLAIDINATDFVGFRQFNVNFCILLCALMHILFYSDL